MDPNANVLEQLALAARMMNRIDKGWVDESDLDYIPTEADAQLQDAARLAELVLALNNWIIGGGFLPTPWRRP